MNEAYWDAFVATSPCRLTTEAAGCDRRSSRLERRSIMKGYIYTMADGAPDQGHGVGG